MKRSIASPLPCWFLLAVLATAGCRGRGGGDTADAGALGGSGAPNDAGAMRGEYQWDLPPGFPVPDVPIDNPMTQAKVRLGRYLFYDTQLSGNGTLACAGCHEQSKGFADGKRLPEGSTGDVVPRNSPGLANVAYASTLTWMNPALLTLEEQLPVPMFGEFPVEMGITGNEDEVLDRFREDERYDALFAEAFPDDEDPYDFDRIIKAIASFCRTLISGDSPYDRYVRQGQDDAMSDSAKRGFELFFEEALDCHHCHNGFNMTNATWTADSVFRERAYANNGLYNVDPTGAYPSGSEGLYEFTGEIVDQGVFRTPSLRNVTVTGPYMHDGSVETLDDVFDMYAAGGRNVTDGDAAGDGRDNPNKSGFVHGFDVTDDERRDAMAFLESLTDETFLTDPRFSNPFE